MEITKSPNKILGKKTTNVDLKSIKNGSLKEFILNMKKALVDNKGIGLAANQVGKDLSIFVIDENLSKENNVTEVFINPEITEYSRSNDEFEEGCLSLPEYFIEIKRAKKIKIKALDENGKKIKLKAKGLLARVIQHEVDHLNGILIKKKK